MAMVSSRAVSRVDQLGPDRHSLRSVEIFCVEQVEELLAARRRLLLVVGLAGDLDAFHEVPWSAFDADIDVLDAMRAVADDRRVLCRLDVVDFALEALELVDIDAGSQLHQHIANDSHRASSCSSDKMAGGEMAGRHLAIRYRLGAHRLGERAARAQAAAGRNVD